MHDAAARESAPLLTSDLVEIRTTPERGRGVFACKAIPPGAVIEAAPVIVLPARDCSALDRTIIHDYYFHWDGDPDGEGRGALGLGLVTLCNHSSRPNAQVYRNHLRLTLDLIATAAIAAGEEVTVDYGCVLWFEPQE